MNIESILTISTLHTDSDPYPILTLNVKYYQEQQSHHYLAYVVMYSILPSPYVGRISLGLTR